MKKEKVGEEFHIEELHDEYWDDKIKEREIGQECGGRDVYTRF